MTLNPFQYRSALEISGLNGNGWIVPLELMMGQVAKIGVRTHGVVMLTPSFDDELRFAAGPE